MPGGSDRPIGKTQDVGWQIGVRRTVPINHAEAWNLITSSVGMRSWLGADPGIDLAKGAKYNLADGTSGEIRVYAVNSHMRLTWQPKEWTRASTLQIRVIPSGDNKTVIAFHQEHLPGPDEREERRTFFKAALDELENIIHNQ